MIISNKETILGKVAEIDAPLFYCGISTAKDGLFKKHSVVFIDLTTGSKILVAKLIYTDNLSKETRLSFHDVIVSLLDDLGTKSFSLRHALEEIFDVVKTEGYGVGMFFNP